MQGELRPPALAGSGTYSLSSFSSPATSSATVSDIVAEVTPAARVVGDIIVLVFWAGWTLGLAFALPAMIRDGLFS